MNRTKLKLTLAAFALSPALSWAAPGDPGTGLASTGHDFTTGTFVGTPAVGLCTYCHTPHKAIQTLLLWNHTMSSNSFTWDVTATTAGTTFPTIGSTYKGPTVKCLSCHDGSVAVGSVAWFDEAARNTGGTYLNAGTMPSSHQIGASGDMTGNHPVGMPYPYLNVANTYNGSTTGSAIVLGEWQATPLSPIRLYNDDGTGNITGGPVALKSGMECSSCHDPHNKASTGDMFLRGSLTGSDTNYICLKCHIK